MPTPLPDQTNPFEKNVSDHTLVRMEVESGNESSRKKPLTVDINKANACNLKSVCEEEEEETLLMQKQLCNNTQINHECHCQSKKLQPAKSRWRRCVKTFKKIAFNVLVSATVIAILLAINHVTGGKILNFGGSHTNSLKITSEQVPTNTVSI